MDYINENKIKATIYVLLAGVCWGTIGIFSRELLSANINSVQIAMLRSLITLISVFFIIMATDKKYLIIDFKDIWIFIGSGILSIAFFNICYFISISENSLSLASILLYTAPSFVLIMSYIFFKEKMTKQKVLALLIAFIGLLCAVGLLNSNIQTSTIGLIAGLGSGIGYALYSIFSRIALNKYNWLTVLFYTFFFATVSLFLFSNPIELISKVVVDIRILINIVALGLFATLLPFLLYTKGLETLETGTAAILAFIEPVVATILGIAIFNETITIYNIGGVLLIIISLIILNLKSKAIESFYYIRISEELYKKVSNF